MDGVFWEYGWPEAAEIMGRTVRWALRGRLPVEVHAEENVWFSLYRNRIANCWVLMLVNQGVNNQYSIGFDCSFVWDKPESQRRGHPVRKCFATAPFAVDLKCVKASSLKARSLIGTKCAIRRTRKGWRLAHPGIREYDVIILKGPERGG